MERKIWVLSKWSATKIGFSGNNRFFQLITSPNFRGVYNISNLKKHLQTYHMISERIMQNYLHEFCYRLNRRYFGEKLFDRLIVAAIYPYWHDCG